MTSLSDQAPSPLSSAQHMILTWLFDQAGGAGEPVDWPPVPCSRTPARRVNQSRSLARLERRGLVTRLSSDLGAFRGRTAAVELTSLGVEAARLTTRYTDVGTPVA